MKVEIWNQKIPFLTNPDFLNPKGQLHSYHGRIHNNGSKSAKFTTSCKFLSRLAKSAHMFTYKFAYFYICTLTYLPTCIYSYWLTCLYAFCKPYLCTSKIPYMYNNLFLNILYTCILTYFHIYILTLR